MSARKFFASFIRKSSRSSKLSPTIKKANHSTPEEDTGDDNEVENQKKDSARSTKPVGGGKRSVSELAMKFSSQAENADPTRRVKTLPKTRADPSVGGRMQNRDSFGEDARNDLSSDAASKKGVKPVRTSKTLPKDALQGMSSWEKDDYSDPEDARRDPVQISDEMKENGKDNEYTDPWNGERDKSRTKKIMKNLRSPERGGELPTNTYDDPWDSSRKSLVTKTVAQPTPSASTSSGDTLGLSDYADPWDGLPKSDKAQKVRSSTRSPDLRRKPDPSKIGKKNDVLTTPTPSSDYDVPWDQKKLNDKGIKLADKKSTHKPSDDYDEPWDVKDSPSTKAPVALPKLPSVKAKPKQLSIISNDYDEPWDCTSPIKPKRTGLPVSRPLSSAQSARPHSVASSKSPDEIKPKPSDKSAQRHMDRKQSSTEESAGPAAVPPVIDEDLPLEKQLWFHGSISRADADKILRVAVDSSFLVRVSESNKDEHSLSIRRSGEIVHLKIALKRNKFVLGLHGKPHSSIPGLIKHYMEHKVPIKGLESFTLLYPVKRT
jgi:hypothetical protein